MGQSLSDARAICPQIIARQIDEEATEQLFAELADWHTNASPIVEVVTDWKQYGDLILDITGVAHLFGDETLMLDWLVSRLQRAGFTVQGAIANTFGAALAFARQTPGHIVASSDLQDALAPLSVAALRITEKQNNILIRMGLKTIGQLYGRNRDALTARFGSSLLKRLDQALGVLEERAQPRFALPEYSVEQKFADPIGLIDDVLMMAKDLSHRLVSQLEAHGVGAQTFHLFLYRTDHKILTLDVNAVRATRDADHIARLFGFRIDRLGDNFDPGFGIDTIRLTASVASDLTEHQEKIFNESAADKSLQLLYDRLASRLGRDVLFQPELVDTHIPENAVRLTPIIKSDTAENTFELTITNTLPRPMRLLPRPEEITVLAEVPDGPPMRMQWRRQAYHLVKASGPERIGMEWWQPGNDALTRDYYVIEDREGCRLWIFREGLYTVESTRPRWFMHGFFA